MKKSAILVLIFFTCNLLPAQNFKGGIVAGIAACQVDGDGLSGYNKPGPVAGGFVTWDFTKTWSGEMQMVFIQKGARFYPKPTQQQQSFSTTISPSSFSTYNMVLSYVEVPFLLRATYKGFMYEAGLSYGRLVNSKEEVDFTDILPVIPNRKFFNNEYSFNIGVGTMISKRMAAFARYNYSAWPIRDAIGGRSILFRTGQYNNNIQITLRYFLSKATDNDSGK
jgi:hypothetical protein